MDRKQCKQLIVKQNCFWKIVVRRMQDVRSMASKTPCAEKKKPFLFANHAPTAFQIHFCLTIKYLISGVMSDWGSNSRGRFS